MAISVLCLRKPSECLCLTVQAPATHASPVVEQMPASKPRLCVVRTPSSSMAAQVCRPQLPTSYLPSHFPCNGLPSQFCPFFMLDAHAMKVKSWSSGPYWLPATYILLLNAFDIKSIPFLAWVLHTGASVAIPFFVFCIPCIVTRFRALPCAATACNTARGGACPNGNPQGVTCLRPTSQSDVTIPGFDGVVAPGVPQGNAPVCTTTATCAAGSFCTAAFTACSPYTVCSSF